MNLDQDTVTAIEPSGTEVKPAQFTPIETFSPEMARAMVTCSRHQATVNDQTIRAAMYTAHRICRLSNKIDDTFKHVCALIEMLFKDQQDLSAEKQAKLTQVLEELEANLYEIELNTVAPVISKF